MLYYLFIIHLVHFINSPRIKKNPLRHGGLPTVDMRRNTDIPDLLEVIMLLASIYEFGIISRTIPLK